MDQPIRFAAGRPTSETNELGDSREFLYDPAGNLVRRGDQMGRVTAFAYDALQRPTAEYWLADLAAWSDWEADPVSNPPLRTIASGFDRASRLVSSSDPDHAYTWTYDALGRVDVQRQTIAGLSPRVDFDSDYNLAGERTLVGTVIGGFIDNLTLWEHDGLGRQVQVSQQSVMHAEFSSSRLP